MATEPILPLSVVSVIEDVLQRHGSRLSDIDLASRKAEEASSRRNEAAGWLRTTVGVVGGKDMSAEPSEEDFRIALRSGIILCNALNKIQPGAIPKVVEAPGDNIIIPDGAALSAYQYFENVRNFLVAVEEMGLPTFEASDLEQGGKSSRIVNCVLALKSYSEWKLGGKNGSWKYGGNPRPPTPGKQVVRKNSEPFMRSLSRGMSSGDKDGWPSDVSSNTEVEHERIEGGSIPSLNSLIRDILSNRKQEEIPILLESLLSKVMEEFEHRMLIQQETFKTTQEDKTPSESENSNLKAASDDEEMEENEDVEIKQKEFHDVKYNDDEESRSELLKQQRLVRQQKEKRPGVQFLQKKYEEDFIYLSKHLHSLASAATGYQKILEENRKVYCRVRPLIGGHPNHHSPVSNIEEDSISLITSSKNGKEVRKTFSFNRVFGPSATQDTQPLIRSVLDGYNVCIFAYGQTGSGKTHTMSGPNNLTEETVGVNYRALRDLFLISEQRKDTIHYDISVQMLEIYNEQLVLLAMNDRSSRSHSCLTVHVQGRELTSGNSLRGCIHLVDLAGSERVDKSEVTGDRNSKLTQLLQDSLGGQAKTLMFVHVSPEPEALGETISTLKFAERVSTIELGAARVNRDSADVKELKEQIASLKAALVRKDGELEHFKQSVHSTELSKLKSHSSSPTLGSGTTGGRKLPRDDSNSIEDQKDDASKLKRRSLDPQDVYMNPPMWPHAGVNGKEDDKESTSGDWVDKGMNRNDSLPVDDSLVGQWEVESKRSSSPLLSPTYLSDPSKICMEMSSTNDSDELELTTSECSESDMSWQSHISSTKATTLSNGLVSKAKKSTNRRQAKNQETRSMIPSLLPSPSRKQPTIVSQSRKHPVPLMLREEPEIPSEKLLK
ncbi:P-loop containing nucleoside triphosphate hydrolase [Sesbania bispinosa]|nr:P-loop containing nucleoside triphosphate hydrolase [Sesbania bispinosa]